MDTLEAIRTVLAVREFRDTPIPEDVVREILEAGRLTASGGNKQPWHFIVVQNKDTLRKLAELAPTGRYIAQAPLAIVVATEKNPYAESDASRAVQSMILAAWSRGVGSNWVGFHGFDAVKPLLGIPDNLDVFVIIAFGYPARDVGAGHKNRKPLRDIAHRERFGQPFE